MIFVECNSDETLVVSLGFQKSGVTHEQGKGEVCKKVKRFKESSGLVDEDPGSLPMPYLSTLTLTVDRFDLKQLTGRDGRKLVVLRPRLEEWIIKSARLARLSIEEYGLPGSGAELHDHFSEYPKRIDRLASLIGDLLPMSQRIQLLRQLL